MRSTILVLLFCAVLLVSGTAHASPGSAEVKVFRGQLTVSAKEAAFGALLLEISRQAGFELLLSPDVSQKTLSTEFSNIEIEKGIQRLLTLINHKNYFIHYGPDGAISKLEIYGETSTSMPSNHQTRMGNRRDRIDRRRMPTRPTQPPIPPQQPNPVPPPMMVNPEEESAPVPPGYPMGDLPEGMVPPPPTPEELDGVPYIPPSRVPAYIPPKQNN